MELLKKGYQVFPKSKGSTGEAKCQGKEVLLMSKGATGILHYFSLHMFSMYYFFLQCIKHFSNVLQFIRQSEHQCLVILVKPVSIF